MDGILELESKKSEGQRVLKKEKKGQLSSCLGQELKLVREDSQEAEC
jgi:hypothetical protein